MYIKISGLVCVTIPNNPFGVKQYPVSHIFAPSEIVPTTVGVVTAAMEALSRIAIEEAPVALFPTQT